VEQALEELELSPKDFLHRSPFTLSMGEARRVALAELFMRKPQTMLLDEPTAGLDGRGADLVLSALRKRKQEGIGIVLVSHDLDLLIELTTRVLILEEGEVQVDRDLESVVGDREVLRRYGYDVPEIVQIANRLRSRGLLSSLGALTLGALTDVLQSKNLPP
jgi:energy-coupling factor transport system ATP-binding protein